MVLFYLKGCDYLYLKAGPKRCVNAVQDSDNSDYGVREIHISDLLHYVFVNIAHNQTYPFVTRTFRCYYFLYKQY